ncbi:MAG: alanine dehydrogenase [Bacteroidales bacterium]|jgi:alanine dehydrogenase|nr:alanine dehydrogenase [Bacteroidales bacterium]
MENGNQGFSNFSKAEQRLPKEEMLEVIQNRRNIVIGIPKEITCQENRVPLTPEAVSLLCGSGHRVMIEAGAGEASHYSDHDFSEAGADVVYSPQEVYKAAIILKVSPPTVEEIDMFQQGGALISALNVNGRDDEYFRKITAKKLTALAYELIRDDAGLFPVVRSMSEIVGNTSILIAARYLSHPEFGRGVMLGGFPGIAPTEVVILGAGTVGENAARLALDMGALVKVFDGNISRLRRIQKHLNNRIYTSVLQPKVLKEALITADIVIGAIRSEEGKTPCVISREMVKRMKSGSVIIDVSIDQGGCFETSRLTDHNKPVFKEYDVTHYCVPNIASSVPYTASHALSNFFGPLLVKIGEAGGMINFLKTDYPTRKGVYQFNGAVTNKYISEFFDLPFRDLDLLISAL